MEAVDKELLMAADAWWWAYENKLRLQGADFSLKGHEFQVDMLQCDHPNQVGKKAAQMTFTETAVIKTFHGMIHQRYPKGTLYLFPTKDDVTDFSRGRFNPLIETNPGTIGRFVTSTDAMNIKKIGEAMLYLRGARATGNIEGLKKTSPRLKTVPVDRIVFDEYDEMTPDMVRLALERVSHSDVKELYKISTPTVPDYGIDKEYAKSDQRVWMIKCEKCNHWTCLETEFPECISVDRDGTGHRLCAGCRQEIWPHNGEWVAQKPDRKNKVGWWISQLNSIYIDPGEIFNLFMEPPDGDLSEVYNSKLGMAYVAAENRLTKADVWACCGIEPQETSSAYPCAMGIDVGKFLHYVIGYMVGPKRYKIVKVGRCKTFRELHDIGTRFNVQSAIIDKEPEPRKARDFQAEEDYRVFLCDYAERQRVEKKVDEVQGILVVRRTEVLDGSHQMIATPGITEIPRRCEEIDRYALEMSNMAKVLREDALGNKIYSYIKLGEDHYRHATTYFKLACEEPIVKNHWIREIPPELSNRTGQAQMDYNVYDYQLGKGGK